MDCFFSPCPRGLEEVLATELSELGIADISVVPGGVQFNAAWIDCYRVNLHSRIASRVLWRIAQAPYRNEADIYQLALTQNWQTWFSVDKTLRVDVTATRSPLRSIEFTTLRIKDAICDRFRKDCGERPSIDTQHPDVRVFAYLNADTCVLYLDTSGEALFKRGWRQDGGVAPLRENLAAGILRLSGWQPGEVLLDPMCGGGTLIVEAAQRILGIPPGNQRKFGFENLHNFAVPEWQKIRQISSPSFGGLENLHASDLSGDAVALTREHLIRAGVDAENAQRIAPKQIDARHIRAPAAQGIMVTNPPYGERIALRGLSARQSPEAFFAALGDTLKQGFSGWRCYVLSSDLQLQGKLRLAPSKRTPLFNGALECRLYEFKMVAKRNKRLLAKP